MSYTPISKMTDNLNIISGLPNRPSDGGYNAITLKAAFDEAANAIKNYINGHTVNSTYVNGLVDELNAKLEAIEEDVSDFIDLQLPDDVIKTNMIDDLQVTEDKLSSNSVTRNKIKNGEVVAGKLGSKAVQTGNIDDGVVDTDQLASGAVTYAKTFGIQKQIGIFQVTVPTTAWSQNSSNNTWNATISRTDSTGYTDYSRMFFYPAPIMPNGYWNNKAIIDNRVFCSYISASNFVFDAKSKPDDNVVFQCLIIY